MARNGTMPKHGMKRPAKPKSSGFVNTITRHDFGGHGKGGAVRANGEMRDTSAYGTPNAQEGSAKVRLNQRMRTGDQSEQGFIPGTMGQRIPAGVSTHWTASGSNRNLFPGERQVGRLVADTD